MSNDLWRTPPEVISYIDKRFGIIQIDLCASSEGTVCREYIDEESDFLDDMWLTHFNEKFGIGHLTWMNPPYSNPLPFVKQAIKWAHYGYGVAWILNNDSSTKWYVELEKHAQILMPITGGRIAFLDSEGAPINGNNKPQIMFYLAPFGSKVSKTDHVNIKEIYPNGKPKR